MRLSWLRLAILFFLIWLASFVHALWASASAMSQVDGYGTMPSALYWWFPIRDDYGLDAMFSSLGALVIPGLWLAFARITKNSSYKSFVVAGLLTGIALAAVTIWVMGLLDPAKYYGASLWWHVGFLVLMGVLFAATAAAFRWVLFKFKVVHSA